MFPEEEQTHMMEDMKIEKNNIEKDAHGGKNPGIHSQDSSTEIRRWLPYWTTSHLPPQCGKRYTVQKIRAETLFLYRCAIKLLGVCS